MPKSKYTYAPTITPAETYEHTYESKITNDQQHIHTNPMLPVPNMDVVQEAQKLNQHMRDEMPSTSRKLDHQRQSKK
jgi:hypothetical protein